MSHSKFDLWLKVVLSCLITILAVCPISAVAQVRGVPTATFMDQNHSVIANGMSVSQSNKSTGVHIFVPYNLGEESCSITSRHHGTNYEVATECVLHIGLCGDPGEKPLRLHKECVCQQCLGYNSMSCEVSWSDCSDTADFFLRDTDPGNLTVHAGLVVTGH